MTDSSQYNWQGPGPDKAKRARLRERTRSSPGPCPPGSSAHGSFGSCGRGGKWKVKRLTEEPSNHKQFCHPLNTLVLIQKEEKTCT